MELSVGNVANVGGNGGNDMNDVSAGRSIAGGSTAALVTGGVSWRLGDDF